MATVKTLPRPKAAIRRFDIFAEYNRQSAMKKGMRAAQAKGYGLWLAKLVAARRFGRKKPPEGDGQGSGQPEAKRPRSKWRSLDGKPQTDKLFDKEIVGRMGPGFYRRVFAPAIREALKRGASYESIRDSLRREWKPEPEAEA
jgi:hypothetical protein